MTHEEYKKIRSRLAFDDLTEDVLAKLDAHSDKCPDCAEEGKAEQEVFDAMQPYLFDAIFERGSKILEIPSAKEASDLFDDLMREAETQTSSFRKSTSLHSVSLIFNSPISTDLALTIKSFFSPLSLSAARARSPESTLSKSLAIFEVNLSEVEGAFFTAKPQVSVTKNIMRINGIDKSFAGVSVINLVIPFLKLKTIFSLYTDVINSENGALIEKQLRDLFLKSEYRDSILIKLQSCSGYLEGSIVEHEDTFAAEFSIPPGLSKFLGSEKNCFIILIM